MINNRNEMNASSTVADRLRARRGEAPSGEAPSDELQRDEPPRYLMNPETGSVDTEANWRSEMQDWHAGIGVGLEEQGIEPSPDQVQKIAQEQFESLVEVRLADGREVPADFEPSQSNEFEWVRADEAPSRAEDRSPSNDPSPAGPGGAEVPSTVADRLRERRGEEPRQQAPEKSPDDELYREKPKVELLPDSQKHATNTARHEAGVDRRSERLAAMQQRLESQTLSTGTSRRLKP
jgi:hypothetical protein